MFNSFGVIFISLLVMSESKCPLGTFGTRCQFQCHCKEPLDCNSASGYCSSGCSSPWSGSNCQQENVMMNVSTFHKNGTGSTLSSLGVDGNVSSCAITANGINGWWMAKLHSHKNIHKMYIITAKDVPLQGWQIMVGNDSNLFTMHRCSELQTSDSSAPIFCDQPVGGQYIAALNRLGPVVICELFVYVCSKYSFGSECERECACKDPTEDCNVQTGVCTSGCRSGRIGLDCQTECSGMYGPGCSYTCGHCNGSVCDSMTGLCPQGCKPGWQGSNCNTRCPSGLYGQNCRYRCGHCVGQTCNHDDGTCVNGCKVGWGGTLCTEECNRTHFGINCSQQCGNCFDGTCDKLTGICTSGCKSGLVGERCNTVCPPGRWGLRCDEHCGRCLNSACNPENGECEGHCEPGWHGTQCAYVCPHGFYGDGCTNLCGNCKSGTVCNYTNGVCPDGCQNGYDGIYCKPQANSEPVFTEESSKTLEVFLGISVTIVLSVMVCLIICLVANWRREDISKYDRELLKLDKDTNQEEVRRLPCNGEITSSC